jgi:AraC-like DNA-binding protein
MIDFFIQTPEQKIYIFKNEGVGYEVFMIVLSIAISLSGIAYVIWSNKLLIRHKKNIENRFSSLEKVDLKWLQFLTWGLGAIWIIVVFSEGGPAIYLALVVFIFLIGFLGIRQEKIFSSSAIVKNGSTITVEKRKEKYAKSGLKKDTSDVVYKKLIDLMTTGLVYKNRELTIGTLASKLEVHPNHLSQIINELEGKNFYDFVNTYRVNEFKRIVRFPENQNITLLALAHDCGFNSKSSFNRYFKKATGQTPSQYFSNISEL